MKKTITEKDVLNFYREHLPSAGQITLREAAEKLGVSHMTVRDHVVNLCLKGLMTRRGHKLYVTVGGLLLDQRGMATEETNLKKSVAGKAGAEALKRRSLETGISRFNPGLAKDAKKIEANIERIVRKAEANDTLHHPRPVYVVLVGEKVG